MLRRRGMIMESSSTDQISVSDSDTDSLAVWSANGRAQSRHPEVCVVVPTRNEAANVVPLVSRLGVALADYDAHVLFVDDSNDDTPQVVMGVADRAALPVHLFHRPPGQRRGGLGGAVLAGQAATCAEWIIVMDGDLQHPPEMVPALLEAAQGDRHDVVVASRYCGVGSSAGLSSRFRGLASWGSTALARLLFPRRLKGVNDPMSGFFAARATAIDWAALRPCGFKILLEILARTSRRAVTEVPFTFAERHAGESKASWREAARYLWQLVRLRMSVSGVTGRLVRFAGVGLTGLIVNLAVLHVLLNLPVRWPVVEWEATAAVIATQVAICWNFLLSERWVFRGGAYRGGIAARFAVFWSLSSASLLAQIPIAVGVQVLTRVSYTVATAVALAVLVLGRFALLNWLLYGGVRPDSWIGRVRASAPRFPIARRAGAQPPPVEAEAES